MEYLVYFSKATTFQHLAWITVSEINMNAFLEKRWASSIHK